MSQVGLKNLASSVLSSHSPVTDVNHYVYIMHYSHIIVVRTTSRQLAYQSVTVVVVSVLLDVLMSTWDSQPGCSSLCACILFCTPT